MEDGPRWCTIKMTVDGASLSRCPSSTSCFRECGLDIFSWGGGLHVFNPCILYNSLLFHWFPISSRMRWCRSDWTGICLFCCYQPLCVVSNRVDFGLFCKTNSNLTPAPPPPQILIPPFWSFDPKWIPPPSESADWEPKACGPRWRCHSLEEEDWGGRGGRGLTLLYCFLSFFFSLRRG